MFRHLVTSPASRVLRHPPLFTPCREWAKLGFITCGLMVLAGIFVRVGRGLYLLVIIGVVGFGMMGALST